MSFPRPVYPVSTCSVCKKQSVFDPCRICTLELNMNAATDQEIAASVERLSGVPAAVVLRALAVEYEDEATEKETP